MLWVKENAPPELLDSIFGMPSFNNVPSGKFSLKPLDNDYSRRVMAAIDYMCSKSLEHSSTSPILYIIKEGPQKVLRNKFNWNMVFDKTETGISYTQFVSELRQKIMKN